MRCSSPFLLLIDTKEHLSSAYRDSEEAKVKLSARFSMTTAFPQLLSELLYQLLVLYHPFALVTDADLRLVLSHRVADLSFHDLHELRSKVLYRRSQDVGLVILGHLNNVSLFECVLVLSLFSPEGPRGFHSTEALQLVVFFFREPLPQCFPFSQLVDCSINISISEAPSPDTILPGVRAF